MADRPHVNGSDPIEKPIAEQIIERAIGSLEDHAEFDEGLLLGLSKLAEEGRLVGRADVLALLEAEDSQGHAPSRT